MNPDEFYVPNNPTIEQLNNDIQYIYDSLVDDFENYSKEYNYGVIVQGIILTLLTIIRMGNTPIEDVIQRILLMHRMIEDKKNLGK